MAGFLVTAYDGKDGEAGARRAKARPIHLEGIKSMVGEGTIVAGGALLDEQGAVVGSTVMVDFPDRAALDAWLAREPYVTLGVWRTIEVKPMRLVVRDRKITP